MSTGTMEPISATGESDRHIDDLLSGHFDRALSDEQRQELDRLLIDQPTVARRFAAMARLHSNLNLLAKDEAAVRDALVDDADLPAPSAERTPHRHQPWQMNMPVAASIAVCFMLGLFALLRSDLLQQQPVVAHLHLNTGSATIDNQRIDERQPALRVGDRIDVPADSEATIVCEDGSRITLDGGSSIRIAARSTGWRFGLTRGRVTADVAKQPTGDQFAIETDMALVRVIGTRLSVAIVDGRTDVAVDHGVVAVDSQIDGRSITLRANQRCNVHPGVPLAAIDQDATPTDQAVGVVWNDDFETEDLLQGWNTGTRIPASAAPPGAQGDWVMQAKFVDTKNGKGILQLGLRDVDRVLFAYDDDLELRIRYWSSPSINWMGAWMAVGPVRLYRHFNEEWRPLPGQWTEVSIPLRDLLHHTAKESAHPGEGVYHIMIQAQHTEADSTFYIDDFAIIRRQ